MDHIRKILRRSAWTLGLGVLLFAATPVAALDDLGPPTGGAAPSIGTPLDQASISRPLASLKGKNGTVLLFLRSADWCPYYQRQLMDLNAGLPEIEKRDYSLAAISCDSPEILRKFTAKREIKFALLSDTKSEVIDRNNLRDPQYKDKPKFDGVPRPIIFILAAQGAIKSKLYEEAYKTRPPLEQILAKLDEARR